MTCKRLKIRLVLTVLFMFSALLTVSLGGCDTRRWPDPSLYRCSAEEMEAFKLDYDMCEQTGYRDTYCYAHTRAANCTKIKKSDDN
jgi:hypothetical protein